MSMGSRWRSKPNVRTPPNVCMKSMCGGQSASGLCSLKTSTGTWKGTAVESTGYDSTCESATHMSRTSMKHVNVKDVYKATWLHREDT